MFKYSPPQETITFAGGEFTVRGLALTDTTQLVSMHKDKISEIFDQFSGRTPDTIQTSEMVDLALALVEHSPALVAHIIALAADALDEFDSIRKLPIDVQVAAIEKICELTFAMGGGAKKFAETVIRLSTMTRTSLKSQTLTNGSGLSVAK